MIFAAHHQTIERTLSNRLTQMFHSVPQMTHSIHLFSLAVIEIENKGVMRV